MRVQLPPSRGFAALALPSLGLAAAALTSAAVASAQDTTADYRALTNTPRSSTNFNVETIRGLAYDAAHDYLYAVNTHGSMLVRLDPTAVSGDVMQPLAEHRTLNNPCALALWNDPGGGEFAIVVGGGTHGVVKQNRNTGVIVGYIELPSEPADIVIDDEDNQNARAYVSCAGSYDDPASVEPTSGGVVVEIDLNSFDAANNVEHFIDGARPTFLNLETGPSTGDNFVYVAPQLSGNRTSWSVDAWGDATAVVEPGLPDEDLFRIDESGNVTAVQDALGTLLMNHGRNPVTQDYWVLNVDSRNAANHTEPDHRGLFADNRISIVSGLGTGGATVSTKSLDGSIAAVPPSADLPASFPFGLAFTDAGDAFVVGSTGDVMRHVNSSGTSVTSFGLPDGTIPRGVLLSPDGDDLFVYGWGTNEVLRYSTAGLLAGSTVQQIPQRYDLGADPQPEAVRDGREIWYDATPSFDAVSARAGKVSCNVCHPRGGLDMLAWDLGDPPNDRKDLMVTQSLLGIEDTFPYHWRGERSLSDFNGAFDKLLGGDELNASDLADFEAFVFSLQVPANPRQNKDRVVDDERAVAHLKPAGGGQTLIGSALKGQDTFFDDPAALPQFTPAACVDCHSPESGTNGLITTDLQTGITTNANLDVAHLRQLHHKMFQPLVDVGGGVLRPRGGFGFVQDGTVDTIIDFFNPAVFFSGQPMDQQNESRVNAASFMAQFDQGIAPRAHSAALFDVDHATKSQVDNLIAQAEDGWIDVAAVGVAFGVPLGLWYDTQTNAFYYAEVGVSPSVTIATLDSYRQNDQVRLLFVGLPPGNGFRFAADHDDDELSNLVELNASLDPQDPDWDDDGLPDGYELLASHNPPLDPKVYNGSSAGSDTTPPDLDPNQPEVFDHVTGRIAKLFVTFTEPVTYEVRVLRKDASGAYAPIAPPQKHSALRTRDTLVAHGLIPGFDSYVLRDDRYRLEVTLTDLAGLTNTITLPSAASTMTDYESRKAVVLSSNVDPLVVESLSVSHAPGTQSVAVTVNVDDLSEGASALGGGPAGSLAGGKTVVLQLLRETAPLSDEFVVVSTGVAPTAPTTFPTNLTIGPFTVPAQTYGPPSSKIPGPFLVSDPTDGAGVTTLKFDVSGIGFGTRLRVVVVGVLRWNSTFSLYDGPSIRDWQMPMTENEARAQTFTL